jgi:putative spermidine/putrescine transport system ATP-binding protein
MQEEVKRLHQELGTTFVFVTHDQSEALSLSSRVAIFNRGELLQLGAPQAVYERPANRFVAEFLGEINLLPLRNVGHGAIAANGHFEDASLAAPARPDCGVDALLAVRPEHMSLAAARPRADNVVAASLRSATYLGAVTRLALATRGGTALTLTLPTERAAAAIGAGEQLWVTWPIDKGFLLPASAPAGTCA